MFNVCPFDHQKLNMFESVERILLKLNILPSKHGKIDADITFYNLEKTRLGHIQEQRFIKVEILDLHICNTFQRSVKIWDIVGTPNCSLPSGQQIAYC